jgi:trans-aconitate 2-methyltransferase
MWNPEQYERFKAERKQPFTDLVSLIEHRANIRLLDLGCGTGELTRELHDHLHAHESVGIDNSETMLLKSEPFGTEVLRFQQSDISAFVTDRPYDLIFSNAALHWIADHETLLHRLTSFLSTRGQLAVQIPVNDDHPSHAIAAELAREHGVEPKANHTLRAEHYAELLHHLGFHRQHVRMQVYGHVLDSAADVVEWVKGTLLTDYELRLGPERFPGFLAKYRERILAALPTTTPYFYTYKRILFWGTF